MKKLQQHLPDGAAEIVESNADFHSLGRFATAADLWSILSREWDETTIDEASTWCLPSYSLLEDSLKIITQVCPKAAGILNNRGQLPIEVAIENGKRTWVLGVRCLATAFPDGLWKVLHNTFLNEKNRIDGVKLLPHLLHREDSADVIFGILRSKPDFIRDCLYKCKDI